MNDKEVGLPWPWWRPDDASRGRLLAELRAELAPRHPLFAIPQLEVSGRCEMCDEILVAVDQGSFGLVHLTWSRKAENPPWPRYVPTGGFIATEAALTQHGMNHGHPDE